MASDADPYREHLVQAGHAASRDYDRAVMALSGGALAVSITFLRDLVPHPRELFWLATSWISFAASLVAIFASLLTSQGAIRRALYQYDQGTTDLQKVGGALSRITIGLNIVAGALFVAGVAFLIVFAWFNVKGIGP